MRSDKKMAIMVISVFVLVFAFVTPASAIQGPCCTNVSACNLTELLATVNLSACWDDYTGNENFELVMIDDKNATFVAIDGCPYGLVGYYNYTEENTLKGVVEVWGLTPNANHQITLNGPGINGSGFSISEETDSALASGVYTKPAAPRPGGFDPFERGYWNDGPWLDQNRGTSIWKGQGIYNIGMNVTTDACGHFCYPFNITLPAGTYEGVKFIVKECTDGDCYNATEGQWVPRLMECDAMEFSIKCNSCTDVDACDLTELLETVVPDACWGDRIGDDNFELVMIDNKTAEWEPVGGCPYGLVGYYNYTEENTLEGAVEVWGLTPNANHQITLNGPGINGSGFSISEETDSALASGVYTKPAANSSFNLFERGYWNSGPYLDQNRSTNDWQGQGIYNIGMNVTTDDCGHFCYPFNITLPSGKYEGVKFIVKECTDGDCYNATEGQWVPRLMECVAMEFIISPSGNAADETLIIKDVYTIMESVYAVGHNFAPNKSVDIYITPVRTWADGDYIPDYAIVGPVNATTDANGSIGIDPKVLMWENPTPGQYQMVFDDPDELFTRGIDIADFFEVLGVAAPVLTPIGIVALVGLLSIIATSTLVIRKKRR